MPSASTSSHADHELVLTRLIDAPRDKVFRCWTEPALILQWFTPPPWKTVAAETDVRAGGASVITMQGPDGTQMPNRGVYLEVIPNERLVFTDAYTSAWTPSAKPFMTVVLTFEEEGGRHATPPACAIGRPKTAQPTRRWASTRAGAWPRTS
jgi:uncharacterized protein YndB with AHSA1/START domain